MTRYSKRIHTVIMLPMINNGMIIAMMYPARGVIEYQLTSRACSHYKGY